MLLIRSVGRLSLSKVVLILVKREEGKALGFLEGSSSAALSAYMTEIYFRPPQLRADRKQPGPRFILLIAVVLEYIPQFATTKSTHSY